MIDPVAPLPPYARTMGMWVEDSEDGPVIVMPPGEHLQGRPGFIHGGALAGLLEMAALAAMRAALHGEVARLRPTTLTIDFQRGGRRVETRAIGRIVRAGTRVANVDITAWQDDPARPIASARMNILLDRDPA